MKALICAINSKYIHSSLAVWYLASGVERFAPNASAEVLEATINEDVEKIYQRILSKNFDIIGFIAPEVTVNIIKDGEIVEKKSMELPLTLTGVIRCKNPRCITTTEQEIVHKFKLTDKENRVYRCIYCETKAN